MKRIVTVAVALVGVFTIVRPGSTQEAFVWQAGWYTDGTSDWYVVAQGDRVLMSTATLRPDDTIAGLVFELDLSEPDAARSRPYGSDAAWTGFELAFDGTDTFLIDGTPFKRVELDLGDDFDVRADTPPQRYGLFFLAEELARHGESLTDPQSGH